MIIYNINLNVVGGHSETGLQKKYFKVWKVHKKQEEEEESEVSDDVEKKPSNQHSSEEDQEVI